MRQLQWAPHAPLRLQFTFFCGTVAIEPGAGPLLRSPSASPNIAAFAAATFFASMRRPPPSTNTTDNTTDSLLELLRYLTIADRQMTTW